MADKVPLKLVDNGSGVGSLVEFAVGDTVPAANLTKAIAVALTGLVAGTNTAIVVTDTILSALQNLQAQTTAAIAYRTGSGYIDGLVPVWNSASSISVTSGSAYIPGLGANLAVPTMLTLSSLSLTASTWHYLYLYSNAGVAAIELVTTAPDVAYSGTSRTKTGDTSRRFIASVKTGTGGALYAFQWMNNGFIQYSEGINGTPFRILVTGSSATYATVSLATVVPPTTRMAQMVVTAGGGTATFDVYISTPDDTGKILRYCSGVVNALTRTGMDLKTDASQRITYMVTGAVSGWTTMDVYGYGSDR